MVKINLEMKISNLILSLGLFLLLSCGASKPLLLEMNMIEGKEFTMETSTNTIVDIVVMGQQQKSLATQSTETKFNVQNLMPNGDVALKSTIINMSNTNDSAQGSTTYDSKNVEESDEAMVTLMQPLIGHEMNIVMNKSGQLIKFEQEDVIEKMFAHADETMMAAKATLEGQFGEEGMKSMIQGLGNVLPNKAVKKGDTWTKEREVKTMMVLLVNSTYTLTERKDGKAYISVVGTTKTDPTAAPVEMMGMEMSYIMSGPIKGTLVVDEKTGWTIKSDIEQVMKGTMKIKNEMIGEMDAQMDMSSTTTTEAKNF